MWNERNKISQQEEVFDGDDDIDFDVFVAVAVVVLRLTGNKKGSC